MACAFAWWIQVARPDNPLAFAQPVTGTIWNRPPDQGTGRTIRFSATEGTWMSLDVSPDGSTIVFDLLGHIYRLPVKGGRASRLTSGTAFDAQPRFSPDGRHVVFVSDRSGSANLWIMKWDDGSVRQLSGLRGHSYLGAVSSPAWSPDGRTIVASQKLAAARPGPIANGAQSRWLLASYDVASRRMVWVSDTTAERARDMRGPSFAPDGKSVYVSASVYRETQIGPDTRRIERLDLGTGQTHREMWVDAGRDGFRPVASRDGRYLAYVSPSGSLLGIRLRDLTTGNEHWLVQDAISHPPSVGGSPRDIVPGYAFTPDNKALIVAYGGKIRRVELATGKASAISFIAEIRRSVERSTIHPKAIPQVRTRTHAVMQPSISPDGRFVAFSSLDRLWVMTLPHNGLPAGPVRRLTTDTVGEFAPSWAPDGASVVYVSWLDGAGGAVRRVPVMAGSDKSVPSVQLTFDNALYFQAAVSPDGRRVAAVRSGVLGNGGLLTYQTTSYASGLNPTLVSLPVNGGPVTTIAKLNGEERIWSDLRFPVPQLYFAEDPRRIYVGLNSWRWDGTKDETGLVVRGHESFLWQPELVDAMLSPDRTKALIARKYVLYEVRLSKPMGRSVDTVDLSIDKSPPPIRGSEKIRRVGTVFAPWMSWSRNGHRALFSQGGTLMLGDLTSDGWSSFVPLNVPLQVPVDSPRGVLVLSGARIITMKGHEIIERGDIVIRDNRIVAVGPTGRLPIPKDDGMGSRPLVLDVSGATILPGYLDLHDHMGLQKAVHPQQCWQCLSRLAFGVTTVREPNPFAIDVFAYGEREQAGDLRSPRILTVGFSYHGFDSPIRTLEDARAFVLPLARHFGPQGFKTYRDPSDGRLARQLLLIAAREAELNATAHSNDLEDVLTYAFDGYPGVEHGPQEKIYSDAAMMLGFTGTTVTTTYSSSVTAGAGLYYMSSQDGGLWRDRRMRRFTPPTARIAIERSLAPFISPAEKRTLASIAGNAASLVRYDGRVAIGAHGSVPGIGYHYELWFHALGGMSNHDVLRAATIVGAEALGFAKDLGSIEPGKLADIQVLDRDPLEEIRNTTTIRHVVKNGRLYRSSDLKEIWPRCDDLGAIYLHEASAVSEQQAERGIDLLCQPG